MDKIIDKFYNGSVQNGAYNKPTLTSNKFSSPNLLENKYNRTSGSKYNYRYDNGQKIMENSPVPRTQYSMGLRVPTIRGNPPFNQSITNPFRSMENPYSTLRKNYNTNQLRLNLLNNRIREMEDENTRNKYKIQRLLEGSSFGPERPYWNANPNYANHPTNLKEAMDNLRNPYLTMEEFKNKQDMRRNIVQYELEQARQRLNDGSNTKIIVENSRKPEEKDYTISNYSSKEDNDSSLDELDRKMKKNYKKLIKEIKKEREYNDMHENEMNNIEDKLYQMERMNIYNNEELNHLRKKNQEMYNALKSKEEAEDFINNIPDHVALQLQNDNFKIRSNINTIKEGFREIKNDLENKLESLELKQNYNFEVIKKIIEEGGNRKMKAGFRKYMNNEEIDLNEIQDELPEHLQFLPYLIEKKIKENEEMKNQEKNRIINERMNKKFDNMEYNYGYANKFYKYKNNYQPFNKQNNNNFVISKNYGRFQYIPKRDNNTNSYNNSNTFKANAQQNLMIMKQKENNIPGLYAYGVGSKNMNDRIPIRMNGCYDDWFKDKNKEGEFQIEESQSDVGINVLKKKIKTKSKSNSLKSKEMHKEESESSSAEKSKEEKKNKKKKDKKENKKKQEESDEESEEDSEKEDKETKKETKEDKKEEEKKDTKSEDDSESGSDDEESSDSDEE